MACIELRGLWRSSGGVDILKGIDLRIEAEETVALIGPTGSGKTTLLRVMNLLDPPTRGQVYLKGVDVALLSEKEMVRLRRRMSMVFQKPVMFRASVAENVALGLRFRGQRGYPADERADSVLDAVGMSGYSTRKAWTLSGGEMQRVALARALVTEPEVLLLDEPTANLDPRTAATIEDLVSRLKGEGVTVVMATHDLDQARRLADRIALVMGGKIVQAGRPEELISNPVSDEVSSFIFRGSRGLIREVFSAVSVRRFPDLLRSEVPGPRSRI